MYRRWLPAVAVAVALLVASVVPPGPAGEATGPVPLDKLLHAAGYAALAGALVVALAGRGRSVRRVATLSFCGAVTYGVAIELLQAGIPYRAFAVGDVVANAAGALVGVTVLVECRRRTGSEA